MNQDEEYGYIFEFDVAVEDLLPDEDTLGSLL
jgi:hypothetical protein